MTPSVRRHGTASCSNAAGPGAHAFDSNTRFATNINDDTVFGATNLGAAEESGALEGAGNTVCDIYSVIAGGSGNLVDSGNGANGHGAESSFIGAGVYNSITGAGSFIGSGGTVGDVQPGNQISGADSFVGAGDLNLIEGDVAFIGAGARNNAAGEGSFIGAGGTQSQTGGNQILSTGVDTFIGSGDKNSASAYYAFLGGGVSNTIDSGGAYATIAGGDSNLVTNEYGAVGGGYGNTVKGEYAVVPGGDHNVANGKFSLAAGYQAQALHAGSFVWSDYVSGASAVRDTAANQFVVRASGDIIFYSSEDTGSGAPGVELRSGSGTWGSISDRSAKTDIAPLDDASILAKVAALPVTTWRYKAERGVRHLGPMAQDFYAAFGVGEDNRHITSIDEDGVALAAIKELHRENVALRSQFAQQEAEFANQNSEKDASILVLEEKVRRLELKVGRFVPKQ